jgi:PAS domain S-box-containing protein
MRSIGRILLIDDDPGCVEFLAELLAIEGWKVWGARSGQQALDEVEARPPNLILLSTRLPDLDGFEVCRLLKSNQSTRKIPVIFMSAAGALNQEARALALGAVDYLVKPFGREDLAARVRTHLASERLRIELHKQAKPETAELLAALQILQSGVAASRRAEAAMREKLELTSLALKAGRTYAFEWNPKTDEVRRTPDDADLPGVATDRARDTWSEFIWRVYAEDREGLTRRIAELTPSEDTCECRYRVIVADGKVAYQQAAVRAIFDENGNAERYIGIVTDSTFGSDADGPGESEERFRQMADTAPMMICMSGPDKQATYFNQAWLTFAGRTLEKELGSGWTSRLHPEDLDRTLAAYSSSFAARRKCHVEYRLCRADGEYRWIVYSGVPRWSADGAFAGYVASCIDITDLKRAQEEAFEKQKLESLRVLTGGIAHDFNNLLGGICVEAELAESEAEDGAWPTEAIRRIRNVASHASEIVRELMIYSGQDKATVEPVNVSRVVDEMVELLKVSMSKHARLETDMARDLPPVLGSATQMRQVVMNLVLNASEAVGARDGIIRIKTSKVTVSEDQSPGSEARPLEGVYVRLEVADTGPGMSKEALAKIFDPFFTTKAGGHGLGLAVVRGIVHSHGGVASATSTPGLGTTFEVLLPCLGNLAGPVSPAVLGVPAKLVTMTSGTILLVEEDDTLRIAVGKTLRIRGFPVLSVASGQAALEVLNNPAEDIGAVVVALTQSGRSGAEVVAPIHEIRQEVPVILTGFHEQDVSQVERAGSAGRVSFLKKPYRIGELVSLLQMLALAAGHTQAPNADPIEAGTVLLDPNFTKAV